jgi:L-ascorbate metabolism protein UlaG (beta-lactamase superfamily)
MPRPDLELVFYGHAAASLECGGDRLVVDPYASGGFGGLIAYPPITGSFGAVVCSHAHADHAAVAELEGSPELIGEGRWRGFTVGRHQLDHDEYGGRRRGGQVDALILEVGGWRVVHLSDVGHAPRAGDVEALRGADLLLLPVGGFYTIGAAQAWGWARRLAPARVAPIHAATPACRLGGMRGAEVFDAWAASGLEWATIERLEWGGGRARLRENA